MEDVKLQCISNARLFPTNIYYLKGMILTKQRKTVLILNHSPKVILNGKISNKLFAKTWWLYDNISFFVPKIRYKVLCLEHFSVNCRALKLQMLLCYTILKCVIRWIKETKFAEDKLWEINCNFNDLRSSLMI